MKTFLFIFVLPPIQTMASRMLPQPTCQQSNDIKSLTHLAAIFNEVPTDDRSYKSGKDDPIYRSIGKLKCGDIAGTGFYINQCHILTNDHFWKECQNNGSINKIEFLYDHNGIKFQKTRPLRFVSGGESSYGHETKQSLNDLDFAIFSVSPCEEKSFPIMKYCEITASEEIHGAKLAGLSSDRFDEAGLSVDENCTLFSGSGSFKNFGHDCASRSKSSGSPIFIKQGDDYCVLAIHTGCYSESTDKCEKGITAKFYDDKTFNFAVPLSRFIDKIPANNPN